MPYNITETTLRDFTLPMGRSMVETLHAASHFRYAVVDHLFSPVDLDGKKFRAPFMRVGLFDHAGKTYAFPFLDIDAQWQGYAAEVRHRIVVQSIQGLLGCADIDGVVIAPGRAAAFHLLHGVTASYKLYNGKTASRVSLHAPVCFVDMLTQDAKGKYIYYPFTGEEIPPGELNELCRDIRQYGDGYMMSDYVMQPSQPVQYR